jgi:hypothetical protein
MHVQKDKVKYNRIKERAEQMVRTKRQLPLSMAKGIRSGIIQPKYCHEFGVHRTTSAKDELLSYAIMGKRLGHLM